MSIAARGISTMKGAVRSTLRSLLSQERRSELKRLQGVVRKKLSPVLATIHGSFGTAELIEELQRRLPQDFEILMVHSSFDTFLPMYKGSPKELVGALIELCGPARTLVMPSFVMGGRIYDAAEFFRSRPFDIRTTPSEMGIVAEIFRRTPNVARSLHPTCSLCALGPLAKELTDGHHLSSTGLSPDSPFGVMTRRPTAILGLGVEYYRCLTHVHTATQQMGDEYPIRFVKRSTQVTLVGYDGSRYEYELGLPDRTRKLDLRVLWSLLSKEELAEWRFHGVSMFLVPRAGLVTERLVQAARRGITIFGRISVSGGVAATSTSAPHEGTAQ
jgi:aminoglycoside 3-N-acetyltransferase